jgi:uncharacterized protein YjbI with pentapeptide repeats
MPEDNKTCQIRMHDRKPCGRPHVPGDDKCICHTKRPGEHGSFRREVDEQLRRDDIHDFTGFVFPDEFSFGDKEFKRDADFERATFAGDAKFFHVTFAGNANFLDATFKGDANFYGAKFTGEAKFQRATFTGNAIFYGVKFTGEAKFQRATFTGDATFRKATFTGDAYFVKATFKDDTHFITTTFKGRASFDSCHMTEKAHVRFDSEYGVGAMFAREASFLQVRIDDGARLTFRKVSLNKCHFLETDLKRVEFIDVTWPCRRRDHPKLKGGKNTPRRWFTLPGNAIYDEFVSRDYALMEESYRQLQANMIENYSYRKAGAFHVGEQEMMRKQKGKFWRYFCPAILYRWASKYGESYWRSLGWLALLLVLFPAIFLYGGVVGTSADSHPISYSFSAYPSDCFLAQGIEGDYWTCFFDNVSFLTFNRSGLSSRLLHPYQHAFAGMEIVLIVTLITFFLLALRRQFKRKSF